MSDKIQMCVMCDNCNAVYVRFESDREAAIGGKLKCGMCSGLLRPLDKQKPVQVKMMCTNCGTVKEEFSESGKVRSYFCMCGGTFHTMDKFSELKCDKCGSIENRTGQWLWTHCKCGGTIRPMNSIYQCERCGWFSTSHTMSKFLTCDNCSGHMKEIPQGQEHDDTPRQALDRGIVGLSKVEFSINTRYELVSPTGYIAFGFEGEAGVPFLSMGRSKDDLSMKFYVDPISSQPMIKLRMSGGSIRDFPLDKVLRHPSEKL